MSAAEPCAREGALGRAGLAECQMSQPEKKLVTDRDEASRMGAGRAQLLCQLLNKPSSLPFAGLPPTHCADKGCIATSNTSFCALKVQSN